MRLAITVLMVFTSAIFISCQKEISEELNSSTAEAQLLGNYKFISMQAQTLATDQAAQGGVTEKTVTKSTYTTQNNTGAIKFDGATATSTNVSYSIDTVVKAYFYLNGAFQDSIEAPMQFSMPPTNGTSVYKMVGSDSIYFSNGSLFVDGSASGTPTIPNGAKLKFDGKKVYMTSRYNDASTTNVQGVTVVSTRQATMVVTLEKQ